MAPVSQKGGPEGRITLAATAHCDCCRNSLALRAAMQSQPPHLAIRPATHTRTHTREMRAVPAVTATAIDKTLRGGDLR